MQDKNLDTRPLSEKVLAGGCTAAFGAYMGSESDFTMTILSVTVLAIMALLQEMWK